MEDQKKTTLPYDILRVIHTWLDIPDRRRFESAMGWELTGIKKLSPERYKEDLLVLRERYRVPRSMHRISQTVRIPIGGSNGKAYEMHTCNPFNWSLFNFVKYSEEACRELNRLDISHYEWVEFSFLCYEDDGHRRDFLHYWSIELNVSVCPGGQSSRVIEKVVQDGQVPGTNTINHHPSIIYSGPAIPLCLRGEIQYYSNESLLIQIEFDR